jgi:hypothetical protein
VKGFVIDAIINHDSNYNVQRNSPVTLKLAAALSG